MLEGTGDAALEDIARTQAADHIAAEPHVAARRLEHAGNDIEQSRLAGTVRADQRDDLAGLDVERHVVDRGEPAELAAHRLER